jgi:hypothetical protein
MPRDSGRSESGMPDSCPPIGQSMPRSSFSRIITDPVAPQLEATLL